jgi:O-antigen/teichoic acid export membrane protein
VTDFDMAVPRSRSLRRDALVLAAGMAVANAGNYGFNLVMAFLLGPEAYGALAALLALVLVGSVPGLALQAVVARRTALAGGPVWPGRRWLAGRAGLGLALLTVVAGPGLMLFLHLGSAAPVLWLALALAPTPLLFAVQGLLQGRERFGALAAVMVAGAGVKLAIGLVLVAAGLGVSGAMAGVAAGAILAALAGLAVPVLGGGYAGLGPLLPLFAALGTGLALVQLLLFEGIATRDRRMGRAVAVALVAEVALVAGPLHGSVGEVAGAALAVVAALAAAGWWLLRQRRTRPSLPAAA